jgi:membrane associated rhomboid family serine protease
MRVIDKFSLTHRRFGIQKLMLYIVIGTGAVFLIDAMDTTHTFLGLIYFDPALIILKGQVWRLITWLFYPTDRNIIFLALMLYFYYFIGTTLEREWGTPKFTIYYIIGVLLNIIYGFAVWLIADAPVFLTSSFLNLSMFFAFAVFYPDQRVLLFFVIPIKIKWLALFDAVYFLYIIISALVAGSYFFALLPIVAVLNFFLFCGDDLMHFLRPYQTRNSKQAINFRKVAKQKKHEDAAHPYRHKCAVCGKTDAEYPNLEFRYCSRCNGYHCFCSEHINNHVHFQ